jgi:hypothetical protein
VKKGKTRPTPLRTSAAIASGRGTDAGGNRGTAREAGPAAPYQIIDSRSASTYGYNNTLIEAATQTQDRQAVNLVDYDFHRMITSIGRRTLMSLGRTMFWRIPALQASILEQANLAVNPYTQRFMGRNKAFGDLASEWITEWHKTADIAGWPYDFDSYTETMVINNIVDGDPFTLLTRDESGNPKIQQIGSHRVGSRYLTGGSCTVRYDGTSLFIDGILVDGALPYSFPEAKEWVAPIIDGVIVDALARPIAYRVYTDPAVSQLYQDYSARDLFPAFVPMVTGQLRGPSVLASSIFDWQDIREWRRFELLAQKIFASKTIVEHNETGEAESGVQVLPQPAQFDSTGKKVALARQQIDGGTYDYIKANSGGKLEAFHWDRPNNNVQDFNEMMVRDAMRGTEWDAFFSLDPKHVGGAPMRVVVDRVNRTLRKRRKMVNKNATRATVYALSIAILKGELPFDVEWYKWTHQGPQDVTADRRYDAQTDEMEYELGWSTMEDIEKRRNGDWLVKRDQKQKEVHDKLTRAKALAEEFDISIQEAMQELGATGTSSLQRREIETEDPGTHTTGNPGQGKTPVKKKKAQN